MTASASPSLLLTRAQWSRLRTSDLVGLDDDDLDRARGLGDEVDLAEVREIYLPLARLIHLHVVATRALAAARADFLRLDSEIALHPPFLIGIAGSVAVGKSTTSRLLQMLLARGDEHPRVDLVTTDGFLLANAELARRGVRKGFPESYDRRGLLAFVRDLKSGAARVSAPVYSHLRYDIVSGQEQVIERPDLVLIEGLNVLQPARADREGAALAVSDFFDLSIYVDAATDDIAEWYVQRFLRLRETAFQDPSSYFHRYASLQRDAAVQVARELWAGINLPNLLENIRPTRERATLILRKGHDHAVTDVQLRR